MKKVLTILFITLCCISGDCEEKEYKPDPILLTLKDKVEQECKKLGLKPTFKISKGNLGDRLEIRYKPRFYIIHPRDKAGKISEKTVKKRVEPLRMKRAGLGPGFVFRADVDDRRAHPFHGFDNRGFAVIFFCKTDLGLREAEGQAEQ